MVIFFIVASRYTREAGVRTLERRLAAVCRSVAVSVAESRPADNLAESGAHSSNKAVQTAEEGGKTSGETEQTSGKGEQTTRHQKSVVVGLATASDQTLPKVIDDEQVIEAILGVSYCKKSDMA